MKLAYLLQLNSRNNDEIFCTTLPTCATCQDVHTHLCTFLQSPNAISAVPQDTYEDFNILFMCHCFESRGFSTGVLLHVIIIVHEFVLMS
jgi:hypothetical protein